MKLENSLTQIERSRKASARDQAKHRPGVQRLGHSKFPLKRRPKARTK